MILKNRNYNITDLEKEDIPEKKQQLEFISEMTELPLEQLKQLQLQQLQ